MLKSKRTMKLSFHFHLLFFACLSWPRVEGRIPLDILEKISGMNASQFINEMLLPPSEETGDVTDSLFDIQTGSINDDGRDIIVSMLAQEDTCAPRQKTVDIPMPEDPNVIYWPMCTQLKQCGGCCGNELLECAPKEIKAHSIQVMKATYSHPDASMFEIAGMVELVLEEHLACSCRCRVQPHHCHPTKHRYLPDSCRCQCINENDALSCPVHKKWDAATCECICGEVYRCMEQEIFSKTTCRCELRSVLSGHEEVATTPAPQLDPCFGHSCMRGYEPRLRRGRCRCVLSTPVKRSVNMDEPDMPVIGGHFPRSLPTLQRSAVQLVHGPVPAHFPAHIRRNKNKK